MGQQSLRHQAWIVVAAGIVFLTNLGVPSLWDEDETYYATTSREMLQSGDWVMPTFNGEVFPHKPPMMYWMMISGFKLFGVGELGARFWSAVLGIAGALATYHLGRLLFRAEVGFWAGLAMASTLLFTVSARAATADSLLVFVTTLSMLLFVLSGQSKVAGTRRVPSAEAETGTADGTRRVPATFQTVNGYVPRSWILVVLMYACMGVAVLTKGPVGLLLPAASIGLFLMFMNHAERRGPLSQTTGWKTWAVELARVCSPVNFLRSLWQMRPLTGLIVVTAVAAPWFVAVSMRTGGTFVLEFLGTHNLQRAVRAFEGHSGPFFYYIPAILVGFFPWSVFLGPCLTEAGRRIRHGHAWRTGYLFAACWVGVFVVAWSIPSTKLPHYVLTAYPALALLTGAFVDAWVTDPVRYSPWWMRNANVTLIVVGIGILAAIPIVALFFLPGEELLGLVGLIPVVGGALGMVHCRRNRPRWAMGTFAVTSIVFVTAMFAGAALRVDRHQNAEALWATIRATSPGEPHATAYCYMRQSFVFYAGETVPYTVKTEDVGAFLEKTAHPYIFTSDEDVKKLEEAFPGELTVVARRPKFLKRGEVVVLTRRGHEASVRTASRPHF